MRVSGTMTKSSLTPSALEILSERCSASLGQTDVRHRQDSSTSTSICRTRSSSAGASITPENGSIRRVSSILAPGSFIGKMKNNKNLKELNQLDFKCSSGGAISGRAGKVKVLKDAYRRLTSASPSCEEDSWGVELFSLAGSAGVGKSFLVQHFADKYVQQISNTSKRSVGVPKGKFGKGKFDPKHMGEPYGAFSSVFEEICWQILQGSAGDHLCQSIQQRLRDDFGGDNDNTTNKSEEDSLMDMIPSLSEILYAEDGSSVMEKDVISQENAPPNFSVAGGPRALHRFHFIIRKFVRAISSRDHPTCIFLDDWQWATSSDIDLLKILALDRDIEGLLIIGCYRNDERSNLLSDMINAIRTNGQGTVNTTELEVRNLDLESVSCWLESLLSTERSTNRVLEEFAEIVYNRTAGNPFHARQFLTNIRDQGLLHYNTSKYCWTWDCAEIRQKTKASDNVVSLILQRIDRSLGEKQARILGTASFIGSSFTSSVLEIVVQAVLSDSGDANNMSEARIREDVSMSLKACVDEGMLELEPSTDIEKPARYRFLHDEIQLAAFVKLCDEVGDDFSDFQSKIGRALSETIDLEDDDQCQLFFVAVDLMNNASNGDCIEMTERNLNAAKRAISMSAFCRAIPYLRRGMALLKSRPALDYWIEHHKLALELYSLGCEMEYTMGNFVECKNLVSEIISRRMTFQEKSRGYIALILALTANNDNEQAVDVCLAVLKELGVQFPSSTLGMKAGIIPSLIKTKGLLKGRDTASLANVGLMEDNVMLMAMDIMGKLQNCSYIARPDLLPLVILKSVRWSIKYGNSIYSPAAYSSYGAIMSGVFGDLKGGYGFGELALLLLGKMNEPNVEAKTRFIVHYGLSHWVIPLPNTARLFREAYKTGLETGDVESAMFCIHWYCLASLNSGKPLSEVEADMRSFGLQMQDQNQIYTYDAHAASWQYILNLLGRANDPLVLRGEAWDNNAGDNEHLQMLEMTRQCWLLYYFGRYKDAWFLSKKTPDLVKVCLGASIIWRHTFYVGLTVYALTKLKKNKYLWKRRASRYHNQIKKWCEEGNVNCHHMLKIFEAERAVVNGECEENVKRKFNDAISISLRSGFRQDAALTNELAGKYFLHRDKWWARHYLSRALKLYEEWEAHALVDHLKDKYAFFFTQPIVGS